MKADSRPGGRGEAERFSLDDSVPAMEYEHLHRYALAAACLAGRRVLDLASGSGYGSRILASSARSVVSLDLGRDAARMAPNGVCGSGLQLPFANASFDAVVCLETIEHLESPEALLGEISRVLEPGGVAILSTPDRDIYTGRVGNRNPYHVSELGREEFGEMLAASFSEVHLYGQSIWAGSWIAALNEDGEPPQEGPRRPEALRAPELSDDSAARRAPWVGDEGSGFPVPMYLVALCGQDSKSLRAIRKKVGDESLLHDPAQWLLGHYLASLEALLERDRDVEGLQTHVANLEALLLEREKVLEGVRRHAENLADDLARSSERVRGLEEHAANLEADVEEGRARVRELDGHLQEVQASHDLQLAGSRQHVENLEGQIRGLQNHAANLEGQISGLQDHAANLEKEVVAGRSRIRELDAEIGSLGAAHAAHVEALLEHAENLEGQMNGLQSHATNLEKEVAGREARILDLDTQIRTLTAAHEAHVSGLKDHAQNLGDQVTGLSRHAANLEQMLQQRDESIADTQARLEPLEAKLRGLEDSWFYRVLRWAKLLG